MKLQRYYASNKNRSLQRFLLKKYALLIIVTVVFYSCGIFSENTTVINKAVDSGNDPNFSIEINKDVGFIGFNRKVEVFEIPIYAVADVEDSKLLHAANLMAQYLDNDEDGDVDNQKVLDAMKKNNAFLFLWKNESDHRKLKFPSNTEGQDLGNDETIPEWHINGHKGRFDAALEEVLHIITHAGYASAYPEIFGESIGTSLANSMDIARGGQFTKIPKIYPENAWYTYDDSSCDYNCMTTEYIYWSLTSILGAQENRFKEINHEWKLNTKKLVQDVDPIIYLLLTDPQYDFPSILPDGTYKSDSK